MPVAYAALSNTRVPWFSGLCFRILQFTDGARPIPEAKHNAKLLADVSTVLTSDHQAT
jgi:hypothetical protein